MIGDIFPEERRSSAISIFWLSTAFGTALSFGMGGYVAVYYGWRAAFFVAGMPGIILALLLFFTVREPGHGEIDDGNVFEEDIKLNSAPPFLETLKYSFRHAALRHIFIAVAFKSCVLSGVLIWVASYFIRAQGLPIAQTGVVIGLSIAIFGGIGSVLGGIVGDKIFKRGGLKMLPLIPFFTSIITAIAVVALAFSQNLYFAIFIFAVFEITSRMYTAPSYSFLISALPSRMRGVNISAMQIGSNLIGYGLGPLIVGVVSDLVRSRTGDADSIRAGLLALAVVSLWVSFHFYKASSTLDVSKKIPN
jgi:predicted MFS family arabinose efflux permease